MATQDYFPYNPLEQIKLPGGDRFTPRGLIVIVGPNSSGKTWLLRDIQKPLLGEETKPVVVHEIIASKSMGLEALMTDLVQRQHIKDNGNGSYLVLSHHVGVGNSNAIQFNKGDIQNLFAGLDIAQRNVGFFAILGRLFLTSLFIDNRLLLKASVAAFNYESQPPSEDLHALSLSPEGQDSLENETGQVFKNVAWLDLTKPGTYRLRVSGSPNPPPERARRFPRQADEFRFIETEGDGYKSYVGICIALLLAQRAVTLIDEPELCLHPPQAYAIGRFIGKHATSPKNATFVATHNSQVLRGILETADTLTVIRMTNKDGKFAAHQVDRLMLKEAIRRPSVREENVLDSVFSRNAILVESPGDRAVYQTVCEALGNDFRHETVFIQLYGKGNVEKILTFCARLKVFTAIIADLDMIKEPQTLGRILSVLTDSTSASNIARMAQDVLQKINKVSPAITPGEVQQRLDAIRAMPMDWSNQDDLRVKRQIKELEEDVKRARGIKKNGLQAYDGYPEIQKGLGDIIDECKRAGLFLVPVGEVEHWLPQHMKGVSKQDHEGWTAKAAELLVTLPPEAGDIWGFMREVGAYFQARADAPT